MSAHNYNELIGSLTPEESGHLCRIAENGEIWLHWAARLDPDSFRELLESIRPAETSLSFGPGCCDLLRKYRHFSNLLN